MYTRLQQLLAEEMCQKHSLALWEAASFRFSSLCLCSHYLEAPPPGKALLLPTSLHKNRGKHGKIRSTKLLRGDLTSVYLAGKAGKRQRLKETSSSTRSWGINMQVSSPIWPTKSGVAAALTRMLIIKTKLSSSYLNHLSLLGKQQKAGKEKRTYPVILD